MRHEERQNTPEIITKVTSSKMCGKRTLLMLRVGWSEVRDELGF